MQIKLLVKRIQCKPFRSQQGDMINHYWGRGERADNGVSFDFHSSKEHSVGETFTAEFDKEELVGGKFRYKEIVPLLSATGEEGDE